MKKILIAAIASSLAISPAMAATNYQSHDQGHVEKSNSSHSAKLYRTTAKQTHAREDVRHQSRAWKRGDRFDRQYAYNYRQVSNPRAYRLKEPPRGYRWVRSNNDAVLVGIASGIIAAVVSNALR